MAPVSAFQLERPEGETVVILAFPANSSTLAAAAVLVELEEGAAVEEA